MATEKLGRAATNLISHECEEAQQTSALVQPGNTGLLPRQEYRPQPVNRPDLWEEAEDSQASTGKRRPASMLPPPSDRTALLSALLVSGCYHTRRGSYSLTLQCQLSQWQEDKRISFKLRREVGGVPEPSDCHLSTICPVLL